MLRLIGMTALATATVLSAQAQPTAADLAQKIQQHYERVTTFTAKFTQEQQSKFLPQQQVWSGTVKVRKPNMMWWTYDKPEKKHWIIDGVAVWDYDVAGKIVIRSALPKGSDAISPLLFLSGRGNLTRDFTSALPASQPAGEWHLELTPIPAKAADADFRSLTLIVARESLALKGLKSIDKDGTIKTFGFTELRENATLTPTDFVFTPPKGVYIDHR